MSSFTHILGATHQGEGVIGSYSPSGDTVSSPSRTWLVTFSDLVLLLLTFLILLFAMSDIDLGRYGALSRSTGAPLTVSLVGQAQDPDLEFAIAQSQARPGEDIGYLRAIITDALSSDARFGTISTRLTEEYLVLSLPSALLFAPGSAQLGQDAQATIFDIAGLLGALDNGIAVKGHVGPIGPTEEPFLTAWELSLARAVVVSEGLRSAGLNGALTILGQGNADFVARSQNLSQAAQAAMAGVADRVDIIIFPHRSGV